MMTRNKALSIYFKRNKSSAVTVERLQKYNPKATVRENAERLKMTLANVMSFAERYGLKFKRLYVSQYDHSKPGEGK